MKYSHFLKLIVVVAFLAVPTIAVAQVLNQNINKAEGWMRIQSDNGEFSIEIPESYRHIDPKGGFAVSYDYGHKKYTVQDPHFIKAYVDQTLICVETYRGKKEALNAIYDSEETGVIPAKIKYNGVEIYQVITQKDSHYSVRQYFNSNGSIYVLVAASRNGRTKTIDRFLNSLKFTPNQALPADPSATLISTLRRTSINIKTKNVDSTPKSSTTSSIKDPDSINSLVVTRPRLSYLGSPVQGEITLRITFAEDGFVPDIEVVKTFSEALLNEAVFAVLRMKFLPKEISGRAVALQRTVIYNISVF